MHNGYWIMHLQALDERIAEALDCPCVEDLKSGPCGDLFVRTFTCYQKSRAEPKGCDCLDVSLAFAVSTEVCNCNLFGWLRLGSSRMPSWQCFAVGPDLHVCRATPCACYVWH